MIFELSSVVCVVCEHTFSHDFNNRLFYNHSDKKLPLNIYIQTNFENIADEGWEKKLIRSHRLYHLEVKFGKRCMQIVLLKLASDNFDFRINCCGQFRLPTRNLSGRRIKSNISRLQVSNFLTRPVPQNPGDLSHAIPPFMRVDKAVENGRAQLAKSYSSSISTNEWLLISGYWDLTCRSPSNIGTC